MKIGNVEINGNVFLAPMAGTTDIVFRKICKECGASFVYSEMVSAKGLYYKDKKTAELMETDKSERPCAIQIFGSDPQIIAEIIPKVIEISDPEIIDINMGCPTPKIVNNGDGSALLKKPKLIGEIMKSASLASPVPVTAKIRKGWDENSINAVEIAKILEDNGASAIAVHGRTRAQFYSGYADYKIIRDVKSAVKIPVIGNGDIFTPFDAKRMIDETNVDAVMVGRGAQGNPFLFRQINEYLKTGEIKSIPTPNERITLALEHTKALVAFHGEHRGICESRKHIAWYIKGLPHASALKTKIFTLIRFDDVVSELNEYLNFLE